MTENLWESVLDEEDQEAIRMALNNPDSPLNTEIEIGSPDGVFVGVASVDDFEDDAEREIEGDVILYVYVADPGTHTEFDPTSETTATRKEWLAAETEQLDQLSSKLIEIVESELETELEERKLRRISDKEKFYDNSELGNGEYYALTL